MRTPLVLLIATEPEPVDAWRAALERAGMTVLHAETGLAGVRDAIGRQPDVVVLDFAAEDAPAVLRARGTLRRVGARMVVLATGTIAERQTDDPDAISFLPKPATTDQLVAEVARLAPGTRPSERAPGRRPRRQELDHPEVCG